MYGETFYGWCTGRRLWVAQLFIRIQNADFRIDFKKCREEITAVLYDFLMIAGVNDSMLSLRKEWKLSIFKLLINALNSALKILTFHPVYLNLLVDT